MGKASSPTFLRMSALGSDTEKQKAGCSQSSSCEAIEKRAYIKPFFIKSSSQEAWTIGWGASFQTMYLGQKVDINTVVG